MRRESRFWRCMRRLVKYFNPGVCQAWQEWVKRHEKSLIWSLQVLNLTCLERVYNWFLDIGNTATVPLSNMSMLYYNILKHLKPPGNTWPHLVPPGITWHHHHVHVHHLHVHQASSITWHQMVSPGTTWQESINVFGACHFLHIIDPCHLAPPDITWHHLI